MLKTPAQKFSPSPTAESSVAYGGAKAYILDTSAPDESSRGLNCQSLNWQVKFWSRIRRATLNSAEYSATAPFASLLGQDFGGVDARNRLWHEAKLLLSTVEALQAAGEFSTASDHFLAAVDTFIEKKQDQAIDAVFKILTINIEAEDEQFLNERVQARILNLFGTTWMYRDNENRGLLRQSLWKFLTRRNGKVYADRLLANL